MYPESYNIRRVTAGSLPYAIRSLETCARRFGMVAVDCETTGLDPKTADLVFVTIATPDVAWVFTPDLITTPVRSILNRGNLKRLAQYAPFDWGFVKRHLELDMYPMWDTRRAFQDRHRYRGSSENSGSSLSDLAKFFLNIDLDKSMATAFVGAKPPYQIDSRHIEYAGIDALILWPLTFVMLGSAYVLSEFAVRSEDLAEMERYLEGRADDLPTDRRYGSLR